MDGDVVTMCSVATQSPVQGCHDTRIQNFDTILVLKPSQIPLDAMKKKFHPDTQNGFQVARSSVVGKWETLMMCDIQISVDELENSISVKISKEAVMSINSPESLFTSVNGTLETKVYIAGLPNRTDNLIKHVSRSP